MTVRSARTADRRRRIGRPGGCSSTELAAGRVRIEGGQGFILGAVTGLIWQERGLSFTAAFKKLRRTR